MALPKALLCSLGDYAAETEEAKLRQAGFATATVGWKELMQQTNDWMQLSEVLSDKTVTAWVVAGEAKDFTPERMAQITLLALSLTRPTLPSLALVYCEGEQDIPPLLAGTPVYHTLDPFAAKLMAARVKPQAASLPVPFYLKAHLDPLIGLWLETGTAPGETRDDYMAGVFGATVTAFGIGPRGTIPGKTLLAYPMLGIEGEMGGRPFSACASKDALHADNACYCKVDGIPSGMFLGSYPDEDEQEIAPVMFC